MSFQEKLRYYREKAGYKSAKEFARLLGVPYTTYVAYENKDREPRYKTLCKIAQLLNVTPNDLLEFAEKDKFTKTLSLLKEIGFSAIKIQDNPGIYPEQQNIPDYYMVFDDKDPFYIPYKDGSIKLGYYINKSDLMKIADSIKVAPEVKEGYYRAFKCTLRKKQQQQMEGRITYLAANPEILEKHHEQLKKQYESLAKQDSKAKEAIEKGSEEFLQKAFKDNPELKKYFK